MRVAFLIPEFPSQTHVFFWREMKAMARLGVQLELMSTRRPDGGACPHAFLREAMERTHYVYPPRLTRAARKLGGLAQSLIYAARLRESDWRTRSRVAGMALCAADLAVECHRRGVDHLHVHSCADAAHIAAMCRLMGGPPYSLRLHGDLPVYGCDHRQKMRRAAFVAAVAGPMRRQVVEQAGVLPERTCVIPMGVDTDTFVPGAHRNCSNPVRLVTVARLNHSKGHLHALRALRRLLDSGRAAHHTMAGAGPHEAAIRAEIERLSLGAHATMAGSLDEPSVLRLLQESDVFVLASVGIGEAAPVSVMEAMSCGLPVVCSSIGGTPEMIDDGRDGLLVPQADSTALYLAMASLVDDPKRRAALGDAARQRAVRQFSAHNSAATLLQWIESCTPSVLARS